MKLDQGTGILYREWTPPQPKAVILLVHGLGAHSERWSFLADFLTQNEISSYALELKGFGETTDLKGHIDSFQTYFNDIISLCKIAQKENPGKKVFLLGESLGGLISFLLVSKDPTLFGGLICMAPAFRSRMTVSLMEYIKIFTSLFYDPKKQFHIPFTSEMCTRDDAYRAIMDADAREHRYATSKLLLEILKAQVRARRAAAKIDLPVLFLLSGEDELTRSEASSDIFKLLKTDIKDMIEYKDMYHALSIDLGKEWVFGDIVKWVNKRI